MGIFFFETIVLRPELWNLVLEAVIRAAECSGDELRSEGCGDSLHSFGESEGNETALQATLAREDPVPRD